MKKRTSKLKLAKNKKNKNRTPGNQKVAVDAGWRMINPNAAGIDLGATEHWVAVGPDRAEPSVRRWGTFTEDLEAIAEWLKHCGVTSVAMEATGVYWIPLFQILERHGFTVLLVNARQTKNVTGRKSDVADCQWIQRLHSYGLLGGSFRPADPYCVVRSYLRYRDELVAARSQQTQHMQKALQQMNLQLRQVVSNTSGLSGLAIIEAIVAGERDPAKLAGLAHRRIAASAAEIRKALVGDYRAEHLFVLRIALELYQTYEAKIAVCDEELVRALEALPERVDPKLKPLPPKAPNKKVDADLRLGLYRKFGVDLTAVEGIGPQVALTMLSEVGPDLSRFPTEKHFTSWLGLCPENRISGGKVLSCHTRRVVNRLSDALRLAATALEHSQSALGAYYHRMKAKLGAAEGVTATAHKLARVIYRLVKHGDEYVRQGMEAYEKKYQEQKLNRLQKAAKKNGFQLVPLQEVATVVS
jgi:transposase